MDKKYKIAIIGTRQLTEKNEVLQKIKNYIEKEGILIDSVRSGNAEGTDQLANEFSNLDNVIIIHYIPWILYNSHLKLKKENVYYVSESAEIFDSEILELFPHMSGQPDSVWRLVRRNFQIILGARGDNPVDLVFWHTIDGKLTGGTRYGVVLADKRGIKTINI